MRGLVLGRFQPFHDGHKALVRTAIEDCVHVVVGIGSSQAPQTPRHPFSFEERRAMIRAVFGDEVDVRAVPDIHDPPRYAEYVLELVGPIDRVYGNDERTLSLFEDAGVQVVRPGLVQRDRLKASKIRLQIAEGDGAWRKAVPPGVREYLEEIGAAKRLRLLEARA